MEQVDQCLYARVHNVPLTEEPQTHIWSVTAFQPSTGSRIHPTPIPKQAMEGGQTQRNTSVSTTATLELCIVKMETKELTCCLRSHN